jgi:hypothetical protein
MKWSLATALFAAPLALAGALQADLVERTSEKDMSKGDMYGHGSSTTVVVEEIVVIWVCSGGGGQTTTMNTMTTVAGAMAPAKTHTVSRLTAIEPYILTEKGHCWRFCRSGIYTRDTECGCW